MNDQHCRPSSPPAPEIHVVPVRRTATWQVHDGDPRFPSSEHASETDAEAAARRRAAVTGAEHVVVCDRYHRTREIALSEAGRPGASALGQAVAGAGT